MNTITKTYTAYAKVNLALDVLGKRPDGYHDVRMIMQNLNIFDELEFTVSEKKSGEDFSSSKAENYNIEIETNKPELPTDESNLIYKAILLMFKEYNVSGDVHVKLTKNIPIEAGMAGGSSDCAATLKAINDIFSLNATTDDLMKLGVKLGADVPFCILGKTALSEGIGEILTPVTGLPDCSVLVVKPPIGVSTALIYNNIKCDELTSRPDTDGMLQALEDHNIIKVASTMENVMETVTTNLYPEINQIKAAMKKYGALNAIMSGSGPTVFGIFTDSEKAWDAAIHIGELELATDIFVTKPVNA
ncbi:MAG: 4-(cytidine 5'-diphospho)-2-C-methyl-D-erythritol kinase [Lachnospiraceae bacterium]|nr:4-(cytidine 5'-diphospho)-2-C-methyl-D-erythritol kinase [Lachnospiraceae bacterium]